MPHVAIDEKGCRGCSLCVDNCPVQVFERTSITEKSTQRTVSRVVHMGDCMGCFACHYLCPSQCIELGDVEIQRPFYRVDENTALVERFLQTGTTTQGLGVDDWEEAYQDVAITLVSLADAIESIMGRGLNALGRRSGVVAAPHFPELYEEKDLAGKLTRLQERFRHSFDFEFSIDDGNIAFTFMPCGLHSIVEEAGQAVGEAVLCRLFHDFWAGLIGNHDGKTYRYRVPSVGSECKLILTPMG
uniref:NAD-dependent dihydropyrimidine dehydrogenase, PreA subunit n=1 Tax=Candidatus Kentrum sp. TUN TaxID=2126343 RepID=A0A450ZXU4_9GAMM|nr:MAG: NAD-dependent dihydropyrimidine dehydrogenase, PreA subunit [Candidatus Kentron sp. TUN]VFK58577.1 MAG: NAD-dependent dihydropyrimidine dehydrogenase, PreA subunit [Candidatus Kentron sp. TUN]VFK61163.1 MAG: NAD-dependent dihydropyrimidine dehydrogenase, PreA subunit [Candidatus Kentron sp. TUN]